MSEKVVKESVKTGNLVCSKAELHQPICIVGVTEANISAAKIKGLQSVEWTQNGFLVVKAKNQEGKQFTHVIPGAAVKNSILAD